MVTVVSGGLIIYQWVTVETGFMGFVGNNNIPRMLCVFETREVSGRFIMRVLFGTWMARDSEI